MCGPIGQKIVADQACWGQLGTYFLRAIWPVGGEIFFVICDGATRPNLGNYYWMACSRQISFGRNQTGYVFEICKVSLTLHHFFFRSMTVVT